MISNTKKICSFGVVLFAISLSGCGQNDTQINNSPKCDDESILQLLEPVIDDLAKRCDTTKDAEHSFCDIKSGYDLKEVETDATKCTAYFVTKNKQSGFYIEYLSKYENDKAAISVLECDEMIWFGK